MWVFLYNSLRMEVMDDNTSPSANLETRVDPKGYEVHFSEAAALV